MSHTKGRGRPKRVQVTFTEEQWRMIERFKGIMGSDDAEVVRNIVLSWLAEKSIVSWMVKEKTVNGGDIE
ncbi:MAG TPA: CopG family transcriptional regulator [Pyrodictiaceae archaeon]|nr:CopG family transcriptional regulator [Pyrodictiaceae archaeon]